MVAALIILGAQELSRDVSEAIDSPLLRRYQRQVQEEESGSTTARKHAQDVLQRFVISSDGSVVSKFGGGTERFGFKCSVDRLELVSLGLVGETVRAVPPSPEIA